MDSSVQLLPQPQHQYRFISNTNVSVLASVAHINAKEREIRMGQAAFNGRWVDGMAIPNRREEKKSPPPVTKRDTPQTWTETDTLNGPLKWTSNEGVVTDIMSFLPFSDVVRCQRVNKKWQQCSHTSTNMHFAAKPNYKFRWNHKLRDAVLQYCIERDPRSMDTLASTYGYPINQWDVSQVECFNYVFAGLQDFNEPIHDWDTSNAKSMICMFQNCPKFNQDISNWNTSKVERMQAMFKGAKKFDKRYVKEWNLENVVHGMNEPAPARESWPRAARRRQWFLKRWFVALKRRLRL